MVISIALATMDEAMELDEASCHREYRKRPMSSPVTAGRVLSSVLDLLFVQVFRRAVTVRHST
jgi:hypothetical protein